MTPTKGKLILNNKVRQWCESHEIDQRDFINACLQYTGTANGKRLSHSVSVKVYNGNTDIQLGTAALISAALGVKSISELFDIS